MQPSSRTPEGDHGRCDVCGSSFRIEPSLTRDAPCPCCGSLVWFRRRRREQRAAKLHSPALAVAGPQPPKISAALGEQQPAGTSIYAYAKWTGLTLMVAGSMLLAGAGIVATAFDARALENVVAWTGLVSLTGSSLPLLYASGRWNQFKQSLASVLRMELRLPPRVTIWERAGLVAAARRERRG